MYGAAPDCSATRRCTVCVAWHAPVPALVTIDFTCPPGLTDLFLYPFTRDFKFAGNRSPLFDLISQLPDMTLLHCIAQALTYPRN